MHTLVRKAARYLFAPALADEFNRPRIRQFADAFCRMIGQPCEHVCKPRAWIDIVALRGLDQGADAGGAAPTFVRSRDGSIVALRPTVTRRSVRSADDLYAMQNHGKLSRDRNSGFAEPASFGDPHVPGFVVNRRPNLARRII